MGGTGQAAEKGCVASFALKKGNILRKTAKNCVILTKVGWAVVDAAEFLR